MEVNSFSCVSELLWGALFEARRRFALEIDGYHGELHWRRVFRNGMRIATHTGADHVIVGLFAIFHDCCRASDGQDEYHGHRSAGFVEGLWDFGRLLISRHGVETLAEACRIHHGGGPVFHDPTIGTCLDSDRLDLWRVGVAPQMEFLSSPRAVLEPEILGGKNDLFRPDSVEPWGSLISEASSRFHGSGVAR